MFSSGDCFVLFGIVSSCLGDSKDPHQVVGVGHNKWYQSLQVSLGISEDSKGSRSDPVEIVC